MGYEIERKFLVEGDFKADACKSMVIRQGYLSRSENSVIRVRVKGEKAFMTIKSAPAEGTIKRHEWEYEIPLDDAEEMLQLCGDVLIEKKRYLVKVGKHTFEVDEFFGKNQGLLIAEVELESEDEPYETPAWLGPEVTGNTRYYNSWLSIHPYTEWND